MILGNLTTLFCDPTKIAVMTFDHEYFLEFCFDDYESSRAGLINAGKAISAIPYIRPGQGSGTRWTHTGGAVQCVCDHILHSDCGFHFDDQFDVSVCTPHAKVIFLTDGHANDPDPIEVCDKVECLHNTTGVDIFAIGIGGPDKLKLQCMNNNPMLDQYRVFNFTDFMEFQDNFKKLQDRLIYDHPNYMCVPT